MGPVALLLQQLHFFAFALDADTCVLHHPLRQPFAFTTCPYQLLKPTIFKVAIQARNKQAITQRSVLQHATQIDAEVFHKAMAKTTDTTHHNITRYIATLGSVHQGTYHKHNKLGPDDNICPFCNEEAATMTHMIWDCKHTTLTTTRHKDNPDIINIVLDNLQAFPTFLLHGIPQVLHSSFMHAWWHTPSPFAQHFAQLPQSVQCKFGVCDHTLDPTFSAWISDACGVSAYDAFSRLAYPDHDQQIEIPNYPTAIGEATDSVNVYSD
eukprot:1709079-Karenia_brevis.AAC.1